MEVEENLDQQQKDTLPEDYPKFRERPDTEKAYDFKEEVAKLPFQFNLRVSSHHQGAPRLTAKLGVPQSASVLTTQQ